MSTDAAATVCAVIIVSVFVVPCLNELSVVRTGG